MDGVGIGHHRYCAFGVVVLAFAAGFAQVFGAFAGRSFRFGRVRQHYSHGDVDPRPRSPRRSGSISYPSDSSRPVGRLDFDQYKTVRKPTPIETAQERRRWDLAAPSLKLADVSLRVARPPLDDKDAVFLGTEVPAAPLAALAQATPKGKVLAPAVPPREPPAEIVTGGDSDPQAQPVTLPSMFADEDQVNSTELNKTAETGQTGTKTIGQSTLSQAPLLASDRRLRPDRIAMSNLQGTNTALALTNKPANQSSATAGDTPGTGQQSRVLPPLEGMTRPKDAIPLARATPNSRGAIAGRSGLAPLGDRVGAQNLAEIPKIYQPRLEPDRSTRAQRTGGSAASEMAVKRTRSIGSRGTRMTTDGGMAASPVTKMGHPSRATTASRSTALQARRALESARTGRLTRPSRHSLF